MFTKHGSSLMILCISSVRGNKVELTAAGSVIGPGWIYLTVLFAQTAAPYTSVCTIALGTKSCTVAALGVENKQWFAHMNKLLNTCKYMEIYLSALQNL